MSSKNVSSGFFAEQSALLSIQPIPKRPFNLAQKSRSLIWLIFFQYKKNINFLLLVLKKLLYLMSFHEIL